MHNEQSLTFIIIIISGNLIHQQEGYYFPKKTTTIFSSNFICDLIIFIEIVDQTHSADAGYMGARKTTKLMRVSHS